MQRTRIKICGITRVEDALCCAAAGVDAIGLVFYAPSPRCIDVVQAHAIVSRLPAFVSSVGLFVNERAETVESVLQSVALDVLQFHGDESVEYCEQFQRPYIKAIRVNEDTDLPAIANRYRSAKAILLDTFVLNVPGGTGQTFDWTRVPKTRDTAWILAGGLNALNVAQAIQMAAPYAVDVSGGVEQAKGIKDNDKILQFVKEVQCVGTSNETL